MARPARLIVEADGAARGNPGPAGYGAVVRDKATGRVLAELAEAIGIATNNVAEYRGLIAGLRAARKINPAASVEARLDSRLVVEQLTGNWKIKHPSLRPLAVEAAGIFPAGKVSYVWVPRQRNSHADRLANEALDKAAGSAPQRGRNGAARRTSPLLVEPARVTSRTPDPPPESVESPVTTAEGTGRDERPGGRPGWAGNLGIATTFVLLRHGETALTAEKRFSGSRRDLPLSDRGEAQSNRVAEFLMNRGTIEVIVSSPLLRTRAMADLVGAKLGLAVEVDEDLRECDFGDWEGHTFGEIQEKWPEELAAWLRSSAVPPPSGESFDAVAARVAQARERILNRHPGRTVLVVSHVTPIKELVRTALGAPPMAMFRMELSPASMSVVQWYEDGQASVRLFNDTSYLRDPL